jgi:putative polymerase
MAKADLRGTRMSGHSIAAATGKASRRQRWSGRTATPSCPPAAVGSTEPDAGSGAGMGLHRASATPVGDRRDLVPIVIVISATVFNAVLAVINAHVIPMTPSNVILVEVVIVLAAHLKALANYCQEMTRWYVLIAILVLISATRGVATGYFEPKLLRDALLIPTFIVLGMTFDPRRLPSLIISLLVIDAAFMMLEALSTPTYAWLFDIQSFYINTRNFTSESFWNSDLPLFLSAGRPDGRILNIIDLHRLSSIFLEPVGSETFCIVVWTYICACFSQLDRNIRWWLVIATLLMIVGTDGRLAMVTSVVTVAVCLVARRLPAAAAFFYLPVVALSSVALVYGVGFEFDADNFTGRLALSTRLLAGFDVAEFLGMSNKFLAPAADSGLAYLILGQSLFGAIILWGFITLGARQHTIAEVRYLHAACAWIALYMMFGASFFTIKVAGLLWFIYGSLQSPVALSYGPALSNAPRLRPNIRLLRH